MNTDSVLKQAEKLLIQAQRRQRRQEQTALICIFDLETGKRVAGCDAAIALLRLPDNRRGDTWHH